MKKFITVIFISLLSFNNAFSDAPNVTLGVSGSLGLLSAEGKETVSGVTGGDVVWSATAAQARAAGTDTAATTSKEDDEVVIGYLSVFGELHVMDTGLRLGLSYVPYALESETTQNTRFDNCGVRDPALGVDHSGLCAKTVNKVQVDLEDLISMYVAYHHELDNMFLSSVFVKAGVIQADVITKENLASGSAYGNTTLDGEFVGLGLEKNMNNGLFLRAEANVTSFDSIKLTNSGSDNTNTINITGLEGGTATLSIGKTF